MRADRTTLGGRVRRLGAGLVVLALATACSGTQPDGGWPQQAPVVAAVPLPPPAPRPQEREPRVPPQVARSFGGFYPNAAVERRLSGILARLVPASDSPGLRYTVTILNSPIVNAFALPDGRLFVTRGLLALANDEAELAAVLAHEMAHVSARHASARIEASQNVVLGSRVLAAVTGDSARGQQALISGAITLASFSRQQELEADQIGIRNTHAAGFDPYGAARFLVNMDRFAALRISLASQDGAETNADGGFLATHPSTPERLALAISSARQLAGPDVGSRERDGFLRVIDGLTFGDDPRTGLVRGRTYLHPGFGFTFDAPEGFSLENTPRAVVGVAADGRALRFDTIAVSQLTALTEALASSATPDLAIEQIEQTTIGTLTAATAVGRSPGWAFRFVLVRVGAEVYRFIYAARQLTPDLDREFLDSARTFRRMSREEIAGIRPYRVRVVTAGDGDTLDTLAARMTGSSERVQRFLALNGLDRTASIRPGTRVKIIAD